MAFLGELLQCQGQLVLWHQLIGLGDGFRVMVKTQRHVIFSAL